MDQIIKFPIILRNVSPHTEKCHLFYFLPVAVGTLIANCVWIWPVSPCAAVSGELEWTSTYLSRCHLLNINYILHFYVAYVPVILSNFTCWTLSMLEISHPPIIPLRIYTNLYADTSPLSASLSLVYEHDMCIFLRKIEIKIKWWFIYAVEVKLKNFIRLSSWQWME